MLGLLIHNTALGPTSYMGLAARIPSAHALVRAYVFWAPSWSGHTSTSILLLGAGPCSLELGLALRALALLVNSFRVMLTRWFDVFILASSHDGVSCVVFYFYTFYSLAGWSCSCSLYIVWSTYFHKVAEKSFIVVYSCGFGYFSDPV